MKDDLSRVRFFKAAALGLAALIGVVVVAVLAASVVLQGPRLGSLIQRSLPENRGKIQIAGVTWSLRALVDLVTDAPSPVTVDGLRIIDPEGVVVLDVPHLEARVKLRTLIGGSFSIHDLKVGKATWRFAAMTEHEGIGFLAALAPKSAPPPPTSDTKDKAASGPGSFFHIVNAELADLNVLFDFPGAWGLELRQARATASLIQSAVDPAHPIFGFDAGPVVAEGGGWLRIMDDNLLPFDRVAINRVATTQERPDDIFLDVQEARTGGSALVARGHFTGIYGATSVPGIDLHAEFRNAADAFSRVVATKQIEDLTLSGPDAAAVIDLRDTFAKLQVDARFSGLDAAYGDYQALGIGFRLGFDGDAMKVAIRDFAFSAPGGGQLQLGATLDATALRLTADVSLVRFATDSYLPPGLADLAAGRLDGRLHADAQLGTQRVAIRGLDLTLARRRAAGLPPIARLHGEASLSPARVLRTSGLTVEVPGATVTATGSLALTRQVASLALEVVASDAARLLKSAGLPPLAKSGRLSMRLDGPLPSPTASGEAVIRGLGAGGRVVPELRARFGLSDGVAKLDTLSGQAFGGQIVVRGTAKLFERTTRRMLKSPLVDLSISARDVDLGAAMVAEGVAGRISFDARVEGPADAPRASLQLVEHADVRVAGESLRVGPLDVGLNGKTVEVRQLQVRRKAGGVLDVSGTLTTDGALALNVGLRSLPLAGLPGLADAGVPAEGMVSANLRVGGTFARPALSGEVRLAGVRARGTRFGDGVIAIETLPSGAYAVTGKLFASFDVQAEVALGAKGPTVRAAVEFERLALEAFLPELAAIGDGKGIASGRIEVKLEPDRPLAVDVSLRELWVSLARAVEAAPGEPTTHRVEIRATRPMHVVVAGSRVTLDGLDLATSGGALHVEGGLDGQRLAGQVKGHLDLELLQPFLRGRVDRLTGDVKIALAADGTLSAPILRGQMAIGDPVRFRPAGFESDVVIRSGSVSLDPQGAKLEGLAVTVEGATTRVDGRLTFGRAFEPETVNLDLAGEISARLLNYVAGEAISDAQGRARIRAQLRGKVTNPMLAAWLGLGTITFRLRNTGTQVEVQSGVVEVSNSGAVLRDVRVVLDDQGKLIIGAAGVRPGQVEFRSLFPFELGRVDFPLRGEQLTYRSAEVFEINDLAFDLDFVGDLDQGFTLGGEVRLIAGRYTQDFRMANLVLSPRVNESPVRPFYDGVPLLENMGLDLTVRTVGDAFFIQNNIAPEIHVDIALHVGGTLSQPRLAGNVRPTDGRFQIPGLRGDFDLVPNVNHVIFVETRSVENGDTPDINIEAQNLVLDASGVEHMVRIRIRGPVREMQIDLSSDGGLDRNQTALLLLTGRTAAVSDRTSTQNPTVGANLSTGFDAAGQVTRDALASFMEPIIGDTFERKLGMQLRLTVGPDGFEGRVRKRISRYMNFQAQGLFGFQGSSRLSLQLDQWLRDYVTAGFVVQRITLSQQQGIAPVVPVHANLELRWDFAIRR